MVVVLVVSDLDHHKLKIMEQTRKVASVTMKRRRTTNEEEHGVADPKRAIVNRVNQAQGRTQQQMGPGWACSLLAMHDAIQTPIQTSM